MKNLAIYYNTNKSLNIHQKINNFNRNITVPYSLQFFFIFILLFLFNVGFDCVMKELRVFINFFSSSIENIFIAYHFRTSEIISSIRFHARFCIFFLNYLDLWCFPFIYSLDPNWFICRATYYKIIALSNVHTKNWVLVSFVNEFLCFLLIVP